MKLVVLLTEFLTDGSAMVAAMTPVRRTSLPVQKQALGRLWGVRLSRSRSWSVKQLARFVVAVRQSSGMKKLLGLANALFTRQSQTFAKGVQLEIESFSALMEARSCTCEESRARGVR
jgi:hypothetical protein